MSVYDSLIDALILGDKISVDDPDFNLASFKTQFYRYARTDFGKMIVGSRQLQIDGTTMCLRDRTPTKTFTFRVVSKSNEQQN